MNIISLIRFLILLSILIFVHEGGHFLLAKAFGVKVEEFGFGLPPRVWGRKIKGTLYSLNLLPIGGFVRLKGEEGEVLGFGGADSFAVKSKFKRTAILAAGALGNFLLAWVIFSFLLGFGTQVPARGALVGEVTPQSPAQAAGLKAGDRIISFAKEEVEEAGRLVELINSHLGQESLVVFERGGERHEVTVTPRVDPPDEEGALGVVVSSTRRVKVSWWEAPFSGLYYTSSYLLEMVRGLGGAVLGAFRGEAVQVGGPVAIYAISETYASGGFEIFAQFAALLSLNLVVVNLIPIPALDGGRILFVAIEAIKGKRINPRVERVFNSLGFALLLGLIILLTIRDVQKFF